MPNYTRTLPKHGISYGRSWWQRVLDSTQKVALYWPVGADEVTVVGYYDTVGAANTAAAANQAVNGAYPRIAINWWHPDFKRINVGARSHRDAREALPAWLDEDPAF